MENKFIFLSRNNAKIQKEQKQLSIEDGTEKQG